MCSSDLFPSHDSRCWLDNHSCQIFPQLWKYSFLSWESVAGLMSPIGENVFIPSFLCRSRLCKIELIFEIIKKAIIESSMLGGIVDRGIFLILFFPRKNGTKSVKHLFHYGISDGFLRFGCQLL